jgi:hypothetical protein
VEADTDGRPAAVVCKDHASDGKEDNALEELVDILAEDSLQQEEVVVQNVQPCLDESTRKWVEAKPVVEEAKLDVVSDTCRD